MKWSETRFFLSRLALWAALSVFVPGVCSVLLSGTPLPSASISHSLGQDKKEFASAVLSSGNSLARLLRSNRQRNGSQGRIFNTRSEGGGVSQLPCEEFSGHFFYDSCSGIFFTLTEEKHFWTDFINSALPVRAGPLLA